MKISCCISFVLEAIYSMCCYISLWFSIIIIIIIIISFIIIINGKIVPVLS
jgi:hypothetical protein